MLDTISKRLLEDKTQNIDINEVYFTMHILSTYKLGTEDEKNKTEELHRSANWISWTSQFDEKILSLLGKDTEFTNYFFDIWMSSINGNSWFNRLSEPLVKGKHELIKEVKSFNDKLKSAENRLKENKRKRTAALDILTKLKKDKEPSKIPKEKTNPKSLSQLQKEWKERESNAINYYG